MKFLGFRLSVFLFVLSLLGCLETVACGGGSSASLNPPPKLGSMAGAWDFTASSAGGHPVAVEAILTQDGSGNISGTGTVTASGPAGNVFQADILGSSLATAADIAVDYLGNTCGADNGTRSITGTINSSNQVTFTFSGGSETVTINGTLKASTTPPFSGSFAVSAPGCNSNGQTGTISAVLASSLTGSYSGTSASDNTETITVSVTDTSGGLTQFLATSTRS